MTVDVAADKLKRLDLQLQKHKGNQERMGREYHKFAASIRLLTMGDVSTKSALSQGMELFKKYGGSVCERNRFYFD